MAVRPDDIVLPPGIYRLDPRADAPGPLQALRPHQFTAHHILPYAYPGFIGFLLEQYRDRLRGGVVRWPHNDPQDPIAQRARAFLDAACRFRVQQQNRTLTAQFAWMSPNLFWGPSGNFRIDDPGEGRETVKPHSMDHWHWDKLATIAEAIDRLAQINGRGVQVGAPVRVRDLDGLLRLLGDFTQRNRSNALRFRPDDWIVMWSDQPGLRPTANPNDAFRARFAAFERQHRTAPAGLTYFYPELNTPRQDGNGILQLPAPAMWRLRLTGEAVPELRFQTTLLQPPSGGV